MNIIVKPYGSDLCYCRPDTTWERESRDFYSPECVNEVMWAPVVFARVSKAGKCIGEKFAERYYDAVGCGMLMYGNNDIAFSSCIDHTSILPSPMYNPVVFEEPKTLTVEFRRSDRSSEQSNLALDNAKYILEAALCKASRLTSLRIGDYVAVELAPLARLAEKSEREVSVKGTFCENEIFGFKIIF
jgi:hypothetical protein